MNDTCKVYLMRSHVLKTVKLLCCSSTDPQHMLLCPQAGGALFGHVAGFVTTRLRQCHTRRSSGTAYQIDRLQSVLNAVARLVYSSRRYDNVTPLLRELHWLRKSQRIDYKLAVLVYTAASTAWLCRTSPTTSSVWRTSTPGGVFTRHQRAHSSCL